LSWKHFERFVMGRTCRVKTDSSPPLCGVHEVRLVLCDDLLNADAPYLGRVHCLRCPVSKKTILKANGFRVRPLADVLV
jgi:hypothetical protein